MDITSILFPTLAILISWIVGLVVIRHKQSQKSGEIRINFVHLDLGIGGAERLVVDAALAFQTHPSKLYRVNLYTTNHPKDHCFPETLHNLRVEVHGAFLPHHIFGKFQLLCSLVRIIYVSIKLVLLHWLTWFDDYNAHVVFCDGVSVCVPFLKLTGAKVMFYCHFPDQLLVRKKSFVRSLYRIPLNYLEEVTTRMADKIMVNSNFTRETFKKTFPSIKQDPEVVYPCIDVKKFDHLLQQSQNSLKIPSNRTIFLSINRFDPNKKVEIAVDAFAKVLNAPNIDRKQFQLVVAGGYDARVQTNVEYLQLLQSLVTKHGLEYTLLERDNKWPSTPVVFVPDVSEEHKIELLNVSTVLIYTPSNEHFGIVPVEAMCAGCAVVAVDSGGLKETITNDRKNGLLCKSTAEDFAEALLTLSKDSLLVKQMGKSGRKRVEDMFSLDKLARSLHVIVQDMLGDSGSKKQR